MRAVAAALCLLAAAVASAADFRSTVDAATITYDAPSTRAKKVGILGRDYPVEVIVNLDTWAKVRDATGALSWVEKKSIADKRTVVVRTGIADVYAGADPNAALVFKAEQGVLLDLLDPAPVNGMVSVRHRDGQAGYVRVAQVWGL